MSGHSDFNDLGQLYGTDAIVEAIQSAASVDDPQQTDPASGGEEVSHTTHTRQELVDMIEASDDFDLLTGPIAQQVAESGLQASTILSLRKFVVPFR